jgi:hypothetical protein
MAPKTEDLGKMFEMAICMVYSIPYIGKYKYEMDIPSKLASRISQLKSLFPMCSHTAKRGARYDFTSETDHLSAKTTKGHAKIAPQVIGQAQPKKFCEIIGIEFIDVNELKRYIQFNINTILSILESFTFDCPIIYYNAKNDTVKFIKLSEPIDWNSYKYSWTREWGVWTNSSTVGVNFGGESIPIMEFQFHSKGRTNMAIRWCFENFLNIFASHVDVTVLST